MSSNLVNQRVNFATVKSPMPYPDFLDVQLIIILIPRAIQLKSV